MPMHDQLEPQSSTFFGINPTCPEAQLLTLPWPSQLRRRGPEPQPKPEYQSKPSALLELEPKSEDQPGPCLPPEFQAQQYPQQYPQEYPQQHPQQHLQQHPQEHPKKRAKVHDENKKKIKEWGQEGVKHEEIRVRIATAEKQAQELDRSTITKIIGRGPRVKKAAKMKSRITEVRSKDSSYQHSQISESVDVDDVLSEASAQMEQNDETELVVQDITPLRASSSPASCLAPGGSTDTDRHNQSFWAFDRSYNEYTANVHNGHVYEQVHANVAHAGVWCNQQAPAGILASQQARTGMWVKQQNYVAMFYNGQVSWLYAPSFDPK